MAERTFRAGESLRLAGYRLTLVMARPPALRLWLNGGEVSLLSRSPEAMKLVVDPANLNDLLQR